MRNQVGELHVHVKAHRLQGAARLAAATDFARRVLSRTAEKLQAQAPGRVVLVDSLRLKWGLREGRLADEELVERWAADLARRLLGYPPAATLTPTPAESGDVVVFADEAQWRAAQVAARSRGALTGAWFFAALDEEGPPPEALAALAGNGGRELVWEVLTRLAAEDFLTEMILSWPAGRWAPLADSLGMAESWPKAGRQTTGGEAEPSKPLASAWAERLRPLVGKVARTVLAMAAAVEVRRHLGPDQTAALRPLVSEVLEQLEAQPGAAGAEADSQPLPFDRPIIELPETATAAALMPVQLGGLFFLLNCALELNLGEILWQACLPEAVVMAHALAGLVGEEFAQDPAVALWTGTDPQTPLPPIDPGQQEEVSRLLLRSLGTALPRRGLAELPEVMLTLASQPGGKLLSAAAGSPLVIFAWPAPSAARTEAGIQSFLAHWPARAPICRATPGVAQLAESGQVQGVAEGQTPPTPFLPPAASLPATALLAQVAGSLSYLFAARAAGGWSGQARDFLERYLYLPAQVRVVPESLTVIFQADRIDMALRRAGLDKDPGWVPWLGRQVGFEFADAGDF